MHTSNGGSAPGRVAIVTGGSHGVGRAILLELASRGYAVVVNYARDLAAAESTVETVLDAKGDAVAIRADVTDELDVDRLFTETIAAFGGVDAVVHSAGTRIAVGRVADVELEVVDTLCRMNTRATLLVNREAARHVRDGGAIVNLTTSSVSSAQPGYGIYAATRATADVLTRVLALELRHRDITVNAVSLEADAPCPPDRVADVVAYLVGAAGHHLTGQLVPLDITG